MKRNLSFILLTLLLFGCTSINSGISSSENTTLPSPDVSVISPTNTIEPTLTTLPTQHPVTPTPIPSPTRQPIEKYCTENLTGTTLEGGNDFPPILLPSDRSSLVTPVEDALAYSVCMVGFLPPEGYNIVGSPVALKLVKELNIDRRVLVEGKKWAVNRWESTTINVFVNNYEDAHEAFDYVEKSLGGTIHFNYVDSEPQIGIYFEEDPTLSCVGRVDSDKETPVGNGSIYIKKRVVAGPCGVSRVNVIIHEIFHALGYNGHTVIRNTTMTYGGIWNDRFAEVGEIDDVTTSVIKSLYTLLPGTKLP